MSINIEALAEKTTNEKLIFDGKVIRLFHDTVELPDKSSAMREYCRHNGGVGVIPVTDDGNILCVTQYRYPHARLTLEIPAGKLDSPEENPDDAVRRELREETGASSEKITFLGLYYGSPALLNEKIYMYLAEDLSFGDSSPDEDEFLEVIRIPLKKMVDMVLNGEIEDGKTQSAVLRAQAILDRR